MKPLSAYKQQGIESANPAQLVLMLYDGLLIALLKGQAAITAHQWALAHDQLIRAQDILRELMRSLNMDAGDISQNLFNLYDFMTVQLAEANVRKDSQVIGRVIDMIQPIREAWETAVLPLA